MPKNRTLGTILAVLLVIAIVYLGTGYLRENRDRQALSAKMNDANKMLSLIPKPPADLQQRLADTKKANQEVRQNILPSDVDTTQVLKSIMSSGEMYHVKVIPLEAGRWNTRAIVGNNYRALTISFSLEGSNADLLSFINTLYGEKYNAIGIDSLTINNEKTPGASTVPKGKLDLVIYTRTTE